ncbi:hypothetical protein [Cupriavidus malaysiensis]|uniref:hypothetical protein n=1 Tax=Cupriavidus malaysiensis TaxID=367825 RepID=UPI0012FF79FC|nr:hypothetical protein [Cupriavidus malaysiensis]
MSTTSSGRSHGVLPALAQDVADMLLPSHRDQLLVTEIPLETAIVPYLHALRTALKRDACFQATHARHPTSGRNPRTYCPSVRPSRKRYGEPGASAADRLA